MLSYCLKCKRNGKYEWKLSNLLKRFIKEQIAGEFFSQLGITTLLIKIALLGNILF